LGREVEVTIPLPVEAARPYDPAAQLKERLAAEGRELPLSKPLSRTAERVAIALIATVVVAGTVLAFALERPSRTGIGWFLGAFGGAILAALVWGHLRGGIGATARQSRAAAQPSTAPAAPAQAPAVPPASYTLASIRARLLAGLLDQALAVLPLLALVLLRDERLVPQPVFTGLVVLAFAIFLFGNAFSLWLTNGRTPGRKLLGMRVVRADGTRMTPGRALRRELGGLAGAGLFTGMQSLASMSADGLRRSSADNRARTVVVVDER
jgi:uncharacterized RDD family membrane protein YckC